MVERIMEPWSTNRCFISRIKGQCLSQRKGVPLTTTWAPGDPAVHCARMRKEVECCADGSCVWPPWWPGCRLCSLNSFSKEWVPSEICQMRNGMHGIMYANILVPEQKGGEEEPNRWIRYSLHFLLRASRPMNDGWDRQKVKTQGILVKRPL